MLMRVLSLAYYGPKYLITLYFISIWDKVVILINYILEIKNLTDKSIINVLQAPIGFREELKSRDHSKGKFIT